ncbi:unnamed protein product [Didymodactylos carnosus]|uniref:Glycosyltransferase family 28 N-terminal domain-containing protein n=1 Tax=Didymodactylos carnosus TaxID=1234261 RepID=A0A814P5P2_9BILA|nr:unnamed protein product [Didymodactylos carnosus]CAF1144535.1 unnamed protein product [Didymodactylos carnosus]CAF3867683.1 unnamed protein product [Didymodactylos carnosus]CAF3944546.1 unnamed protein product [Didymodactylos carnosus]
MSRNQLTQHAAFKKSVVGSEDESHIPELNICIMTVGSQGDVQPFIVLAKGVKECDHRVRLATHENFRDLVTKNGYPLGGDPDRLMAYMVKNRGIPPTFSSIIYTHSSTTNKRNYSINMESWHSGRKRQNL